MSTVRPVLTEFDLGEAGWSELHKLARQRRRSTGDQAVQLVRFALERSIAGEDVELTQERLEALLATGTAA